MINISSITQMVATREFLKKVKNPDLMINDAKSCLDERMKNIKNIPLYEAVLRNDYGKLGEYCLDRAEMSYKELVTSIKEIEHKLKDHISKVKEVTSFENAIAEYTRRIDEMRFEQMADIVDDYLANGEYGKAYNLVKEASERSEHDDMKRISKGILPTLEKLKETSSKVNDAYAVTEAAIAKYFIINMDEEKRALLNEFAENYMSNMHFEMKPIDNRDLKKNRTLKNDVVLVVDNAGGIGVGTHPLHFIGRDLLSNMKIKYNIDGNGEISGANISETYVYADREQVDCQLYGVPEKYNLLLPLLHVYFNNYSCNALSVIWSQEKPVNKSKKVEKR